MGGDAFVMGDEKEKCVDVCLRDTLRSFCWGGFEIVLDEFVVFFNNRVEVCLSLYISITKQSFIVACWFRGGIGLARVMFIFFSFNLFVFQISCPIHDPK